MNDHANEQPGRVDKPPPVTHEPTTLLEDENQYIRAAAQLDEDAFASADRENHFTVRLRVRIARCTYDTKESLAFKWWGESDGLRELLAGLKKGKSVDLLAKLENAALKATSVRIERMDFTLDPAVPLLLLPARKQ